MVNDALTGMPTTITLETDAMLISGSNCRMAIDEGVVCAHFCSPRPVIEVMMSTSRNGPPSLSTSSNLGSALFEQKIRETYERDPQLFTLLWEIGRNARSIRNLDDVAKKLGLARKIDSKRFDLLLNHLEELLPARGFALGAVLLDHDATLEQRNFVASLQAMNKEEQEKICSAAFEEHAGILAKNIKKLTKLYPISSEANVVATEHKEISSSDLLSLQKLWDAKDVSSARWDEGNRSNSRFQMRISKQLKARMDESAENEGLDRSAWFAKQAKAFLQKTAESVPDEYPDYRTKGVINLRIPDDLNSRIEKTARTLGIKKADWARRLIFHAVASRATDLNLHFSL